MRLARQRTIRSVDVAAEHGGDALAEFFASVNLSQDETWTYELKTFPRPTGRATRVIVTEYDLPRKQIQPHDVLLDKDGMVWFSHFGELFLGKMDPKTGQTWQYPVPVIKAGFPVGTPSEPAIQGVAQAMVQYGILGGKYSTEIDNGSLVQAMFRPAD